MKRLLATSLLLAAAVAFAEPARLAPKPEYPDIAQKVVRQLSKNHLSGEALGDRLSAVAWTNLVDALDYDHTLLTQEDLRDIEPKRTQIDDMLAKGDLSFGYNLMHLVRQRLELRCKVVDAILAEPEPFDFSEPETYQWKRRKAERPADREAQLKLWRTVVKNEWLALLLTKELDAEEAEKDGQEAEAGRKAHADATGDDLSQPIPEIIAKRYRALRDAYAEMDTETVLQRYLSAVANAYDPHTDYMGPANFEEFNMGMNLTLCGIGATLRYDDGLILVTEIMPGTPAGRDTRDIRLQEGDRIIGIGQGDGPIEDVRHKPLSSSIRKIRGPKGSVVTLKVIPASDKSGTTTKIVDLVRDEISLDEQAVTGRLERLDLPSGEERRFGYVRIPAFYAGTVGGQKGEDARSMTRDLLRYVQDFNARHADGLVIDLRNNGGGSLMEALMMNALFVNGPVVQVRDAKSVQVLPGQGLGVAFRKPIVVLVNRNSASASEIVAAALQDYGRAIVVGDSKTHGKGTVQTVQPLGDSKVYGADRITTACFYRINGGTTQLHGVIPDIVIPSIYDAMELGEDTLPCALPATQVPKAYYAKTSDVAPFLPKLRAASAKRLAADPQYGASSQLIDHVRAANAEQDVPLQIGPRRERMRAERAMQKLQDEAMAGGRGGKRQGPTREDDPVLREAFNILSDYIDLRGGPDEPVNVDGDLSSRFYRIFGR